jgi:prepilin-type N-terminal cleavage/methylation domain-containing protein
MKLMGWNKKRGRQQGFTMIELMVSVTILTVVVGVVVEGLTKLMQRNKTETTKVDLTQESREFMDQIVNDIHQAGYPSLKTFDPATKPLGVNDPGVATPGLVSATPSSLQFEGDVDGTGVVQEVYIQLNPLNGPCPCTIQRGTVPKSAGPAAVPAYYTEVNNVNNTNIFQGYDVAGNNVPLLGGPTNNLKAIEITLSVKASSPDTNGLYPTITMSTSAKITNSN